MPYFLASVIFIFSVLFETSFLPHFSFFSIVPFVTLALLVAISVRYRGYLHLFVALFAGMYLDFASQGAPGIFTGTFVTVALVGRAVFFRDTGYDATQSFLWLMGTSTAFIYLVNGYYLVELRFKNWEGYLLRSIMGTALSLVIGFIIFQISGKFIDWLNKKNEERFR